MADMDLETLVGTNVKDARLAKHLTQGQLAQKAGLTSGMAVSRWETGRGKPSTATLVRLGEILGHELAWFYTDHSAEQAAA